jgi:hypothetical protein
LVEEEEEREDGSQPPGSSAAFVLCFLKHAKEQYSVLHLGHLYFDDSISHTLQVGMGERFVLSCEWSEARDSRRERTRERESDWKWEAREVRGRDESERRFCWFYSPASLHSRDTHICTITYFTC